MDALRAVGWVDATLLGVLVLSIIVGLVRGFVFECLSLAGWLVAWFAAQWAAPSLAPHVPVGSAGSALNMAAAFAVAFLAALVLWSLLARLIRMLIHATPLSVADRLLGGSFGALRALVLLMAVCTVVALTPAAQSTAWGDSMGAQWLSQTLLVLKPLLPDAAARLLPS